MLYSIKMNTITYNDKILMFMGLLVITFAFYYLLVGKRLTTIHEDSKGEDSWNRYAGTFLLIFTAIITDYQLVFTTPDVMLIGTLIGIAVAGKVINTRIKEYPNHVFSCW